MTRRRTSLATRMTALCLGVAAVALVVAGLVGERLVSATAKDLTQQALSSQADVVAGTVKPKHLEPRYPRFNMPKTFKLLTGLGVTVIGRHSNGSYLPPGDEQRHRAAAAAGFDRVQDGTKLSTTVTIDGEDMLVEVRGLGKGMGVALVRPVRLPTDTTNSMLQNMLLAIGIGLAVAAVGGLVLARLLSGSLRRTASVAAAMRDGRRDVRAPVSGPAEVAEVAESVNRLADALGASESRQREFLMSVSHELRTPLTAVKGFAESLAEGVVEGEQVPAAGRTIHSEAARLERLVSDLLDLARLGADEFRLDLADVDLTRLLHDCAEVWQQWCSERGVTFRFEPPPYPVLVRADPRRLRQALDVLADNALRVTPPGAPLVLACHPRADTVIVQVRDGGPGLSEQDYREAFDRGALRARYRGKRPVGSGIGLALAHGLITRMDGALSAGPAPEGGAAFSVSLTVAGAR